jgi:hypothetical protein
LPLFVAPLCDYNGGIVVEKQVDRVMDKVQMIGRIIAVIVGITLIVIGVRYAVVLFDQIYEGVTNPASAAVTLDGWARYIVSDLDGMEHNGALGKVEHLRLIALFIVAIGGFMLTWLTIHLIVAGARVIQIATTWQALKGSEAAKGKPAEEERREREEPGYTPLPPRQTPQATPHGARQSPQAVPNPALRQATLNPAVQQPPQPAVNPAPRPTPQATPNPARQAPQAPQATPNPDRQAPQVNPNPAPQSAPQAAQNPPQTHAPPMVSNAAPGSGAPASAGPANGGNQEDGR